jgi:hypothetical protein
VSDASQQEQQTEATEPTPLEVIKVNSIFGTRTRKPIVVINFRQEAVQVDPATARDLAMNLLRAAEAATSDAITWYFHTGLGLESDEASMILFEYRKLRSEMTSEGTTV